MDVNQELNLLYKCKKVGRGRSGGGGGGGGQGGAKN